LADEEFETILAWTYCGAP